MTTTASSRTLLLGLEENSSSNKFSEDLTELDREEIELNQKIDDAKQELHYIEQALSKYMALEKSLKENLQSLEIQRKSCLMRRNTLMATHNVFGSPSNDSSSLFGTSLTLDNTTSILLGKRSDFLLNSCSSKLSALSNGTSDLFSSSFSSSLKGHNNLSSITSSISNDKEDINNGLNIDLSEMVSGLFKENHHNQITNGHSTSSVKNNSNELTNNINNDNHGGLEPLPLLTFSRVISRDSPCSTPSSVMTGSTCSVIGSRSTSSLSPMSLRTCSKELDDGSSTPLTTVPININGADFPSLGGDCITSNNCVNNSSNKMSSTISIKNANASNLNGSVPSRTQSPLTIHSVTSNSTAPANTTPRIVTRPLNANSPPTPTTGQKILTYNAVLALEASTSNYVYKSLADKSVSRYKFGSLKETTSYVGHTDKVKVLCLDQQNHNFLYTGCDDGKVRCYKVDSGSLLAEYQCEGSIICLEKAWDHCLVVATNKGHVYMFKNQFTTLIASHRVFNWICALKPLHTVQGKELKNKKALIVLPMKHKPTLIDAMDGKILREVGNSIIDSKPCIQVNGSIVIIATVAEKNEYGKSVIAVYDANNVSVFNELSHGLL